jgi:hypothetical protein
LGYNLPIITGSGSIARNFPAVVQNTGLELLLASTNLKNKNLKWKTSFSITLPKNKLVEFPNLNVSTFASQLVIGEPITIQKVFHFLGVNQTTGVYSFSDKNGAPTSTPNFSTDANVLINTSPQLYGGIENTFTYKSFELNFFFQFVKQKAPYYFIGNYPGQFYGTSNLGNQPVTVLNHWQKPGDNSRIQQYSEFYPDPLFYGYTNATVSDASWSDASFIRLKNLSLSWQFPNHLLQKLKIQNLQFFVHGQNLMTITKYKGLDPETKSSTTLPVLRTFSFGFQTTL